MSKESKHGRTIEGKRKTILDKNSLRELDETFYKKQAEMNGMAERRSIRSNSVFSTKVT